jgi:hypothetical protein
MAKIQSIDPWVPSAVAFGSQVVSGIGNYFEGKNRVKYQNKVAQMQEDARKRIAEAQKQSVRRANYFSLLTGQNLQAEPVDFDLPVIPAYESGGWSKALRGVGQGLGYASQATDTLMKMQDYNEAKASRAGEQAAAMHIANVNTGGMLGAIDPETNKPYTIGNEVEAQKHRIAQLRGINADKAWENATDQDSKLGGLFSGSSDMAFKSAYSDRIANAGSAMKKTYTELYKFQVMQDQDALQEEARIRASESAANAKLNFSIAENHAKVSTDFTTDLLNSEPWKRGVKLINATDNILALVDGNEEYDAAGKLTGYKINRATANAVFNLYQRTMDDGVVHEADINRIISGLDNFMKSASISIEAFSKGEVASISPGAAFELVGHTERLKQNALKHLYADVESRSQAYAGGYNKPFVAKAFGWTGREDAYNTFKNISDQHMRQFLGDQSGDPFGVSKNEAEEHADFIAAEKALSDAKWRGEEHEMPAGMETDFNVLLEDVEDEEESTANQNAYWSQYIEGPSVVDNVKEGVTSALDYTLLGGVEGYEGPSLTEDIRNTPGDLMQQAYGQRRLAGGPVTNAVGTAMAVPTIAAQHINRSLSAYNQLAGQASDAASSALSEALFGPANMQNVRSSSPQGIARELRDMDPATLALGALLFGNVNMANPNVRFGGGGYGGGGGVSGLLRSGGPRGLPGGPYSGLGSGISTPSLGSGTALGLPPGSPRIAYPNSRIWTGP